MPSTENASGKYGRKERATFGHGLRPRKVTVERRKEIPFATKSHHVTFICLARMQG
jgi:hypothetical protein